jgi:hypothetical protein
LILRLEEGVAAHSSESGVVVRTHLTDIGNLAHRLFGEALATCHCVGARIDSSRTTLVGWQLMADDRMTINHGLQDWQLGFKSAVSGWADIPPAGVDRAQWLSGWREGRRVRLATERQRPDPWPERGPRQQAPVN